MPSDRRERRSRFNDLFIRDVLEGAELHYVYALVSPSNRLVGYFGVTMEPRARMLKHKRDAKRTDSRNSHWKGEEGPEMVIMAICTDRQTAEIIERCLIRNFSNGRGSLANGWVYENSRQQSSQMVLDDIPFWMTPTDQGFVK